MCWKMWQKRHLARWRRTWRRLSSRLCLLKTKRLTLTCKPSWSKRQVRKAPVRSTSRYGVQSPRMSRHTKKACEISKTRRMPTQGRSMNWKRRKQTWLLLLMTPQRKLPRKRLILHKERSMPLPLSKRRHRMKATRHARRSRTTPMQQRKAFRTSPTIWMKCQMVPCMALPMVWANSLPHLEKDQTE